MAFGVSPPAGFLDAVACFPALTEHWHREGIASEPGPEVGRLAISLHALNFRLWHHEDQARRRDLDDAQVVRHKRTIDLLNAQRNQTIEKLDTRLAEELMATTGETCSETPGMMADRLSVLALRIFHVALAEDEFAALPVLQRQFGDLERALATLVTDVANGRRRFQLYRQFKTGGRLYCPLFEGVAE